MRFFERFVFKAGEKEEKAEKKNEGSLPSLKFLVYSGVFESFNDKEEKSENKLKNLGSPKSHILLADSSYR